LHYAISWVGLNVVSQLDQNSYSEVK
jgi:hypothetical protein